MNLDVITLGQLKELAQKNIANKQSNLTEDTQLKQFENDGFFESTDYRNVPGVDVSVESI